MVGPVLFDLLHFGSRQGNPTFVLLWKTVNVAIWPLLTSCFNSFSHLAAVWNISECSCSGILASRLKCSLYENWYNYDSYDYDALWLLRFPDVHVSTLQTLRTSLIFNVALILTYIGAFALLQPLGRVGMAACHGVELVKSLVSALGFESFSFCQCPKKIICPQIS